MNKQKLTAYMFLIWTAVVFTGCAAAGGGQAPMYLEAKTKADGSVKEPEEPDQAKDPASLAADGADADPGEENRQDAQSTALDTYFVYVCGAVKYPGVFEMPKGSRIYAAIAKAGGLRKDACVKGINQAQLLADGTMIEIPTKQEYRKRSQDAPGTGGSQPQDPAGRPAGTGNAADGTDGSAGAQADGLVDLNTADAAQLMTLNGIGEAKAAAILAYREENGRFSDISEIKNVRGIGESVYAGIQDKIKVT